MKTRAFYMVLMLMLGIASMHAADPPANDNFADRTMLSGREVSFGGTLDGATFEWAGDFPEVLGYPFFSGNFGSQTVWWEWSPPESGTATLQITGMSKDSHGSDGLAVYRDLVDNSLGNSIAGYHLDSLKPHSYFTFPVEAGSTYQIEMIGSDSAAITMRLVVTNLPWIVAQPKSSAVSTGDSTMFGVIAAGQKPFSYQWQFNGSDLAGETAPILSLDHAATNQAGEYRVLITNPSGTTTSSVAGLVVTEQDPSPILAPITPATANQFAFSILGEAGRRYRVQASTNLQAWADESAFPSDIFQQAQTSVVLGPTGSDSFSLTRTGAARYFRAAPFHAPNEVCNNNLKCIRFAQLLVWSEADRSRAFTVSAADLAPYLKGGLDLFLPPTSNGHSGHYSILQVASEPTCSDHPACEEP